MPLLRERELLPDDGWTRLDENGAEGGASEDEAASGRGGARVLLSLERYLALAPELRDERTGVVVAPADDVARLVPVLDDLPLIGIDFPAFTDGRGYSHARRLRRSHGYAGELRALGDVRPDEMLVMLRAGIDTLALAGDPDPALLERILASWRTAYRPGYQPSYQPGHRPGHEPHCRPSEGPVGRRLAGRLIGA